MSLNNYIYIFRGNGMDKNHSPVGQIKRSLFDLGS